MAGEADVTHEIDPLAAQDDFYGPAQTGPIADDFGAMPTARYGRSMAGGGGDGGGGV